jgi:hypothetical protein
VETATPPAESKPATAEARPGATSQSEATSQNQGGQWESLKEEVAKSEGVNQGLGGGSHGEEEGNRERSGRPASNFETGSRFIGESVVEVLGILAPGLLFLFFAGLTIAPAAMSLADILCQDPKAAATMGAGGGQYLGRIVHEVTVAHRWELVVIGLIVSYVLGHAFYRQDPKEPDRLSYLVESAVNDFDRGNWVVDSKEQKVEFPYARLRRYLEARGHYHLLWLVPWGETSAVGKEETEGKPAGELNAPDEKARAAKNEEAKQEVQRSKTYINVLKLRLMWFFPQKCGPFRKNEGHVRLMASVWYAARALAGVALAAAWLCLWNAGARTELFGWEGWLTAAIVVLYMVTRYLRGANGRRLVSGVSEWIRKKCEMNIENPKWPWQRLVWSGVHRPGRMMELVAVLGIWTGWGFLRFSGHVNLPASNVAGLHLLWVSGLLFGTHWLRHSIERSLHYQRIREVVYVLELAYLGYQQNPKLIEGLKLHPPKKEDQSEGDQSVG